MKVFISSLISGMEAERASVKAAIELLRHEAAMAEDFGARASSSQVACLDALRQSDLVVLILGTRYGAKQLSGLSATHEEYREARGQKPILAFLQQGEPEAEQAAFISEAGKWESGLNRATPFSTPEQLRDLVTRALHDYALTHARAPLDAKGLASRAQALLPDNQSVRHSGVSLHVAIAAGPEATILRPAELEAPELGDAMEKQALFGAPPVFDRRVGTECGLLSDSLAIFQERSYGARAEVRLWGMGDIRFLLPIREEDRGRMGLSFVIEEAVVAQLAGALNYAAWLLGHIDPTERITHFAVAAALVGEGAMGWRTRSEHAASPNAGTFGGFGQDSEREKAVLLSPPHRVRAALSMDVNRLVEDMVVLLRRKWKARDGHD